MEIRNFCIIAHVDHGKSTLADRLLEITGSVSKRKMKAQLLDMMDLEREKGITIKLQPVKMHYSLDGTDYMLNLIDTPGHVDFTYEVSRSIAACEGALLLIDVSQGIEAQTLSNLYQAMDQNLVIIPVLNKVDLPNVNIEEVEKDIKKLLGDEKIYRVSAKTGEGVEELLKAIVAKVPAPKGVPKPTRALVFDSRFSSYKGVEAYLRIIDGEIKKSDRVKFLATDTVVDIIETGIFLPQQQAISKLKTNEVGYISTGLKDISKVRVGDTVVLADESEKTKIKPLEGYKEPLPVVFAGFYPSVGDDYPALKDSLEKLKLSDAALSFEQESSKALGFGFRVGCLGLLHLEIIQERLKREYDQDIIVTSPTVTHTVKTKQGETVIHSPSELPPKDEVIEILEPWTKVEIICPQKYIGELMELIHVKRGIYKTTEYLGDKIEIFAELPLSELVIGFYDKLKSVSQGYASLNYEIIDFREGDLVKLDVLINREPYEAFSQIIHRDRSVAKAKTLLVRLKDLLPRQQFNVPIQATVDGKVVAREDIKSFRKDVIAHLYGGDVTRKMKLLEKQKKGKKKMKQSGKLHIPQETFLQVLKEE